MKVSPLVLAKPHTPPANLRLWESYYEQLTDNYLFPNEYVVRTFLGTYPNLTMSRNYKGAKVCDVGCGDGRNITLLHKLGFEIYATEATEKICAITKNKLLAHPEKISIDIRVGLNSALPFEAGAFDYLLSWNACYYMPDEKSDIRKHVAEFARVMKRGGYLIVCVPGPECFSLAGAEELGNNLIRINTGSRWSLLNGSIYYRFASSSEIEAVFGSHFHTFQKAVISDDCFGVPLHYFIFVCQRK